MGTDDVTSNDRVGHGLTRAVSTGMAWSAASAFGRRAISTIVFIVLARLLVPEDFGLVALAGVFVAMLGIVRDQGLIHAVVQRRSIEPLHLDTAFVIAVGAGTVLTAAVVGVAPLVARVFDEPELAAILMGLAPALFLGGLKSVPAALLLRGLHLRSLAIREFIGVSVGGAVGIAAALAGWGAWALVAQTLTDSVVGAVLLWIQVDWRPRLRFSRRHFSDLFGFSVRIFGSQVLVQASRRSDDLLVGGVLGAATLGLYSVAYRLMTITNELFVQSLSKVMFPTVAQLQDDPDRLRKAVIRAVRSTSAVAVPAFVGMAIVSRELVVLVFGPEWAEAGAIAAVLAIGGIPLPLWTMQIQLLNGTGNPGLALRAHLANAVISVVGFALAVRHGIFAVAAVFTIRGFVVLPVASRFTNRCAGVGLRQVLRASMPSVVAGASMGAVGVFVRSVFVGSAGWAAAVAGGTAAAAYVAVLALAYPRVLRELQAHLLSLRRKPRAGDHSRRSSAIPALHPLGQAEPDDPGR